MYIYIIKYKYAYSTLQCLSRILCMVDIYNDYTHRLSILLYTVQCTVYIVQCILTLYFISK